MTKAYLSRALAAPAFALSLSIAACTGQVQDEARASGGAGAPAADPGDGLLGGAPAPGVFAPEAATLRRLTLVEYENTLRDLFGATVTLPSDLEPDTLLHGSSVIGASRVALSARAVEQFEAAALALTEQVFGDAALRETVTGCDPATEAECTREFVERFGRRVFRRPLSSEEQERYATLGDAAAQALNDPWSGPRYAALGLLQSPNFLYRVELGVPDPSDPTRRVFRGYELATRLSYFLWDTTPDVELLDAAGRGDLDSEAGLLAEAERLLESPRAERAAQTFFAELFRLDRLGDLVQLPSAFPEVTATLGPALRQETLSFFSDLVARDAGYRTIFETRKTFVNRELAALYGVAAPNGDEFGEVTLPADGPRAGILGQAGFLANNAHPASSSPTLRGKFIREVLLCQAIPPPPPDVVTDLAGMDSEPRTMREKLAMHSENPACAACHKVMDPIGLALENFDGIGAYRSMDAGKTIDASGELDGVSFSDALGLGSALARHTSLTECLVRSVYRKGVGHLESSDEQPLITSLGQKSDREGTRIRALMLDVIRSAGFRYAAASTE